MIKIDEKTQEEKFNEVVNILEKIYQGIGTVLTSLKDFGKSLTLGTWLKEWYNTYKHKQISPSTAVNIETVIRLHIDEELKNLKLTELTASQLKKTIYNITSTKLQQEAFDILNGALRIAYEEGYIIANPMSKLTKPRHKRENGMPLTLIEQQLFLKAIKNTRYENYFLFLLLTGSRPGEGLLVRWEDINWENNTIYIHGTKNETSDRLLPLFKNLHDLLKSIQTERGVKNCSTGIIFRHSYKRMLEQFKACCPTQSNRQHTPKDLRHTFATRCTECGVSLKTIQHWLGHSSINTTANIYTHILSNFELKESHKVDNLIPVRDNMFYQQLSCFTL